MYIPCALTQKYSNVLKAHIRNTYIVHKTNTAILMFFMKYYIFLTFSLIYEPHHLLYKNITSGTL